MSDLIKSCTNSVINELIDALCVFMHKCNKGEVSAAIGWFKGQGSREVGKGMIIKCNNIELID